MTRLPFEPAEFLERIGRRLIGEFDDAAQAGTPGLVGDSREHPARRQFERLLPRAAGVGTGLVIDTGRNASKQQDIVVFERDLSPVFSINDTADATYYPVEGVVAVGEVKSAIGTKELRDAFEKVASVKRLRRLAVPTEDALGLGPSVSFRNYGSTTAFAGTPAEAFDQDGRTSDQVYGFILCHKFGVSPQTILVEAEHLWAASPPSEAPNLLVSLSDGFIQPSREATLLDSRIGADSISFCALSSEGFPRLVQQLNAIVRAGRTVEITRYADYLRRPEAPDQYPVLRRPFGWPTA